ncbi:peptidase M24 [Amylocystis lapponica]|nr:peptidase M24 [Amylocystis lapponica]
MSLRAVSRAAFRASTPLRSSLSTRRARKYATKAFLKPPLKPSPFGQPLYSSHPHLIKEAEITPGINAVEYERRRRALMDSLPEHSLVVCVAGQIKYMSGQIFYSFRQSSDFWYLTGFAEPAAALILEKNSSSRGYRMTLFSGGTDAAAAQWDGARTTHADLVRLFGADDARPSADFHTVLRAISPAFECVYVDIPASSSKRRVNSAKSLLKYLSPGSSARSDNDDALEALSGGYCKPLGPEVGRLRAIKSKAEQQVLRVAADISARAHTKTMRFAKPDMSEHVLAAHFEYLCAREGSQRPAYVPVVASGANALTIHYTANNQLIRSGELVLIDAGCEYNGYVSDITRTFPASGTFTKPQAALYHALLAAQKRLVTLCTESAGLSLTQLHRESGALLARELARVGLDLGPGAKRLSSVYPHFVGHPVGIDLHESSHFDRHAPIKAGMVITIEPGIYVPPSSEFPTHFHNIGIRIEDEVLVGKDHPVVLSASAPKEIADVEGACQGLLGLEPF